jgi:hypothetical protein
MQKLSTFLMAGVAALAISSAANAAVIFSDNFNSETQQLNYTGFANWTVSAGSVDLIGAPSFFNFYPGNGNYVDLDGSTGGQNPAGGSTTNTVFAAGSYTLDFNLGGSTRGDTNTVRVVLGDFSQDITLASNAGFTLQSFTFTTTGGALSFTNLGPSDNLGLILDNVSVSAVPEPATWAMMLIGFAGLGYAARRRAQASLA